MKITEFAEGFISIDPEQRITGEIFNKLSALPGRKKWAARKMIAATVPENVAYINDNWPDADWVGNAKKYLDAHAAFIEKAIMLKAKAEKQVNSSDFVFKREPMAHQRKAFELSKDEPVFAYLMEQGTGKTKVACDVATHLFNSGEIDCMLVIAWPNGVHANWSEYELPVDIGCEYESYTWTPQWSTRGHRMARHMLLNSKRKILKVFLFNIESVVSEGARWEIERILRNTKCLFVIDQSACIKNPAAKRTKFILKMAPLAKYRRILDGDPCAEGAEEFYCQFKFLDEKIIGCSTFTAFKSEYCKVGFFREITGYKNKDQLFEKIAPFSVRVLEKDCLNIPPRTYHRYEFELSEKEFSAYEQMLDESRAEIEGYETGLAMLAITRNMRLQQISSGWLAVGEEDEKETVCINGNEPPARFLAFCELAKLLPKNEKLLVFSRFTADLIAIQEGFGPRVCVSYRGGISESDRAEAKRRFMNDPQCRILCGQPKSLGIGHTLTSASHVIFYANDNSLRFRTECEKRAHRTGQKGQLKVWDLIAKKTTDSKIVRCLRQKREIASEILKDPTQFFLEYED